MSYKNLKSQILEELSTYKEQVLGISDNGDFRGKEYSHILPKDKLTCNFLSQVKIPDTSFHIYAHHLNSSQVMCINFFEPLLCDDGRELLHKILYFSLGEKLPKNGKIIENTFEKVLDSKEGTNFDFYLKYSTGEQIFFEIKYTESEFGKITNNTNDIDKYERKWNEIYSKHLEKSYYLKDCQQDIFYKDYQINRNISYLQSEKDFLVFLFPKENSNLVKEINNRQGDFSFCNRLIFPYFWGDIIDNALTYTKDTKYFKHYLQFVTKYFPNYKLNNEILINPKTGEPL